jgi:hypothetical protein
MTEFTETAAGESKELPAKMVIYGVPKIGKSRFAAQADDVFFINIEGGLDYLPNRVRATPKLNTYDEVLGWLKYIYESPDFKCGTIAVDSLDWLETLAQQRLCKQYNAKSITDPAVKDFAYFRGVVVASEDAAKLMTWLDAIYKKKGIKAIVIAHSQIKEVDLPTKDPFQRNELKLSKQLAARVAEWADLLLFADYSFHVTSEGKTSEQKAVLYAGGSPSFVGGGRMQLKNEIPIDYKLLTKEITK